MRRSIASATAALAGALILTSCGQEQDKAAVGPAPADKALLAALPAPFDHGDLDNGRLHFALCRSCHTIAKGAPAMTGPNLYGVFGRPVASAAGYSYSAALKAKGGTWDAAALDKWITSPQADAPGTKMSFIGIKDVTDRRDVIAYLKVAAGGGSQ